MCNDFECIHDQIGLCNFCDMECNNIECERWDDCAYCVVNQQYPGACAEDAVD